MILLNCRFYIGGIDWGPGIREALSLNWLVVFAAVSGVVVTIIAHNDLIRWSIFSHSKLVCYQSH